MCSLSEIKMSIFLIIAFIFIFSALTCFSNFVTLLCVLLLFLVVVVVVEEVVVAVLQSTHISVSFKVFLN